MMILTFTVHMLAVHIFLCYANDMDLDYTLPFEDMPRKCEGTKKPDFPSYTHTHVQAYTEIAGSHSFWLGSS